MATFTISIVNSEFRVDEDYEIADVDAAKKEAVSGALQIGVEHIIRGHSFFGAEITIEQDSEVLARFLVSVGAAQLM